MKKGKIILLNLVIIAYGLTIAEWIFDNELMFFCSFGCFTVLLIVFMIVAMITPKKEKPLEEYDDELIEIQEIKDKYEDKIDNQDEDKADDLENDETSKTDDDNKEKESGKKKRKRKNSDSTEIHKESLEEISERFRRANRNKGEHVSSNENNDEGDIALDESTENNDDILKIDDDIELKSEDHIEPESDDEDESENDVEDIVVYRMEIEDLKKELEKVSEELESAKRELYEYKSHGEISADNSMSILPGEMIPKSELDTINIVDIAKNVAEELHTEALRAGLRIQVSAGEEQILVRADKELLRVLFRNIVDNSIKYMNRQGMLVITLSTIGDDLFVVLKDNGDGLAQDETNHIFELNYQGSNRISGNGLGLAQAKAVVEYYGGNIYAKSTQGGGMGIYIQLPTL